MKRVFSSFQDAAKFSRSLVMDGIHDKLKRNGNTWEVHYTENKPPDTKQEQIIQKLKKVEEENENLRVTIDQKAKALSEQKNRECDVMLAKLSREKNQIISSKQKLDVRSEEIREALRSAEQRALDVIKEVTNQLEVIEALKTAYTHKFGAAEIIRVTRDVTEKVICWRCDGDGTAGNCVSCNGTGMFSETIRVPEYKAKLISTE